MTPGSRRIEVNIMERKSLFLKSSSDGFECLGVTWLKEEHEGTLGTDLCSLAAREWILFLTCSWAEHSVIKVILYLFQHSI